MKQAYEAPTMISEDLRSIPTILAGSVCIPQNGDSDCGPGPDPDDAPR